MNRPTRILLCLANVLAFCAGAPAAEIRIPYAVAQDGRVSLAVYNQDGQLVRTLLTGRPHTTGEYVATWDGLDRYGNALPAGEYSWKLLATAGLRAEFITQVGQNVDPVWERATGNHAPPNSVAVDASGLYRVGATNEGAHWGVKTDLGGRHVWTNDRWSADPWVQDTVAVTLVGDRLFELMPNGHVYGYDAKTGRVFTGGDFDPKPWQLRWNGYEPPQGVKDEDRRRRNAAESPRDLAGDAAGGLLVAAFTQHEAIAWFRAKDGQRVDTATNVAGLAGVAVAKDGTVFAIAGGAVVTLSRENKTPRIVIAAEKLQSPWRLCVSPKSGDVFVAENSDLAKGRVVPVVLDVSDGKVPDLGAGAKVTPVPGLRHHQVKRFAADGTSLKCFGKPEGRSDGMYVATDFRGLTDIEADADGGFVVTEGHHTPPRRSARFDADGNLLREWFGAQHYGVIACPEPGDPRFVWTRANADLPGLLRWEVDYDHKTSRLVEVYQDSFAGNRFFRNNSAHGSAVPTVFQHAGRIYIYNGGMSSLTLCLYDPATKRVRPSNASTGPDGRAVIWNDQNDDGQVSDDEILPIQRNIVGGYLDPADLTLRTTPYGTRYQAGHQITPKRFTAEGTPVYVWSEATQAGPWRENGRAYHPLDFRRSADGSWYGSISDSCSNPHEGTETHGAWYYNSCSAIDRLVKWSRDGKPLWSVGRHSPDNDHETGSTAMPRGLVGLTHGCVVWGDASDEETARPTVWTEDGLYVDELLRVPTDNLPKEAYGMFNANEYPMGHLHTTAQTGEVFFYALNSGGGSPVYRITGWDGWQRAEGTVAVIAAATDTAKRDGTGLKGEYFNTPDCSGEPALTRVDKVAHFNWGEGGQDGVPDKTAINADIFSARWSGTYEAATNEDTRFEIRGGFPWRAKGQPLWSRLWLGGELVFDSKPSGVQGQTTYDEQAASSMGTVAVKLRAGQRIDLRLECGFKKGQAAIALSHDTPSLDRRVILPEFLHPEAGPQAKLERVTEQRPEVIAAFDFEQPEGNVIRSTAGVEVFGRLTGDTRRVAGKTGRAVELAAKGEFEPALLPIDEELRLPDTDYTIAFCFKTTSPNVGLCEAKRYSSYNNRWSDHIVSVEGGKVRFQLQGDGPLETTDRFNDGQWHHVVTTVGLGGQRLHVDGRLIATGKLTKRSKTSNRLGLDLGPGDRHAGVTLDEVSILGRAITPSEVNQGIKP